ncbi:MAG: hypothetical protein R3E39_21710 [Anaerolineae bacterium]
MESGFGDFISQPFVGALLGMMCFFGLMLVATIGALVYVRRRRAQREQQTANFTQSVMSINDNEMPDLSLLVTAMSPDAAPPASPKVQPAATTPAAVSAPIKSPPKGTFSITPRDGTATEAVEVMTLLRDVADGSLIVQMGDKVYQNIRSDREFNERFNKVLRELSQLSTQVENAATTSPTSVENQPVSSEGNAYAVADVDEISEPPFLNTHTTSSPAQPLSVEGKLPGDLPSYKLDDNPMPKLKRGQKLPVESVPEVNIAGAIEAYLQHKLRQTGAFNGQSIHIYPAPDGGVSIEVDGNYFDAVGDIADNNVRAFIAEAITEWQERH